MRLLLLFLLCLSLAAPPAAWAHASSASPKESGSIPVDLSRPPRVITPEIIAHLREAATARDGEKTAAAASGLGRAHSALLSRVAALSSASSSAGKLPKSGKRVGEDGGREMMRSVLEAAAAKEGRGGSQGAQEAPATTTAAEKLAALAAGRGAASAAAAAAARSKRPTVTTRTVLPPPASPSIPPSRSSSPLWLPKPVGLVWKRLAAKKKTKTMKTEPKKTRSRGATREGDVDEL